MLRLPVLALLAVAVLAPARARAMGAVVGKQGEDVELSAARIAVATTASRTTRWAQVSVVGASGGFAWLVPVRAGARIDLASDAWLDALDAATAPVVLAPTAADLCDAGDAPQRVAPATSAISTSPTETALFADLPSLTAFVASAGYAIPANLSGPLQAVISAGGVVLAATFETATLPTRAIRIVDDGAPSLPFATTLSVAGNAAVTAFVVGAGGASAGASPLAVDPSTVLWVGDDQSTYAAETGALLAQWQGARWLTESALPDLLFDGATLGAGSGASLPAVLAQYFAFAQAYGDSAADPAACTAAAYALRADEAPFVAGCPAGALGIAPGPSPCGSEEDGGTPIDSMRCGAADDAAFAVAALAPADVWVTRIEGIVTGTSAADVPVTIATSAPVSPVVTAGGYAATCEAPPATSPPPGSPTAAPPSQPPAGSGASAGSGSSASSGASPTDAAPAAEGCGAAIADSCSSSDSSSDDDDSGGCGSGSGSSEGSSSDSCGSSSTDQSSSSNCATAARARGRGRSPVSRILVVCAAAALLRRRRRNGRQECRGCGGCRAG